MKHWAGLGLVVLVWITAGFFIFKYKDNLLVILSRLTVHLPEPGEQDPKQALVYVNRAVDRVESSSIRLDLMKKACHVFPAKYRGDTELYRPHWLEKIRDWNAGTAEEDDLVEPDDYWKENRSTVIASIQDLLSALAYAYEVPWKDQKMFLLPELVSEYAAAVCMPEIGMLAWGDYTEFAEARAWKTLEKDPYIGNRHLYLQEKDLFILNELRSVPSYFLALQKYLGGPAPSPDTFIRCEHGAPILPCMAPEEAEKVYNRLIYLAGKRDLPFLRLGMGRMHLLLFSRHPDPSLLENAADDFTGAMGNSGTDIPARLGLARSCLLYADAGKTDYLKKSYDALKSIREQSDRSPDSIEFRRLMRLTLSRMHRFRDADCFSDLSDIKFGERQHCMDLKL